MAQTVVIFFSGLLSCSETNTAHQQYLSAELQYPPSPLRKHRLV